MEQREEAVNGIWQIVGLGCIITGQYADAGAISMHAPPLSHEIADLASKNDSVAKGVDYLLQVGPYAGIIGAAMPLVMQILANHKVIPAEKMAGANVVKPEILEAQVKTNMARQAMEVMQQQQQAEEELRQMQEDMMAHQNGQSAEE
jgi:hypothetical protein